MSADAPAILLIGFVPASSIAFASMYFRSPDGAWQCAAGPWRMGETFAAHKGPGAGDYVANAQRPRFALVVAAASTRGALN
jgi:hypothetical protein